MIRLYAVFEKRLLMLVLSFLALTAKAQTLDSINYSLESLKDQQALEEGSILQQSLNEKVGVASKKALTSRETPGIVSSITAEDIRHMGARDLIDVLQMIPGVEFAADLDFQQGLGMRGNWATEGKVLVMIDGVEINETMFQTVQFGNHFPVDQIEKIEIIRGPGSAIYGGTAEYGVINLITKGDSRYKGLSVQGTYGMRNSGLARRNIGLVSGLQRNHWHLDFSAFAGEGNRGSATYTSPLYGVTRNLQNDYAKMDPAHINAGIKYKNASLRFVYDNYRTTTTDYKIDFRLFTANFKYPYKLTNKFTLLPQVTYHNYLPWHYKEDFSGDDFAYKVRGTRLTANLSSSYDITRKINLVMGGEFYNDLATDELGYDNFGEGINEISFTNTSAFSQLLLKYYFANITMGARFDHHSAYGSAFVPRIAVTKRIDDFHFKALYSRSYRAPGIENINANADIKPERSSTAEFELGYQFTSEMLLTTNLFRIGTKDVIVYDFNALTNEGTYLNYKQAGTQGIEMEYKIKDQIWSGNLAYSFYQTLAHNTVATYKVADRDELNIAFPAHKITLNTTLRAGKSFYLNPSLVYRSQRYTYVGYDEEDNAIPGALPSSTQINVYVHYDDLLLKGLSIGTGIFNLLDQDLSIPQAYNGGYAPVPIKGKEYVIKVSYQPSF